MLTSRRYRWLLTGIVLGYLALGTTYALATPPLEASDEYKHYPVVQHVQTQRSLPVLDPADPGLWLQEGAQPPLYYLLMAALTAPIDTSDLTELHHTNPHAFNGIPGQVANKNLIIHNAQREAFPWRGSVLAVYLIRFASIGLGVGTVLLAARLGSDLFTHQVGLLAAALTAFNPMFLFVSAAVNNDSLAILVGHLSLYLLVRMWQTELDPRTHWRRCATLGAVLGLGMLTKLSLGSLLALTGVTLACLALRRRAWRLLFVGGITVLVAALAVSGWWFVRNVHTYGDPTGLEVFIAVQGTREAPMTWQDWTGELGTFYRSYWGLFGGVNVPAPEPFYVVCNLAALAGAAGLLFGLAKKRLPAEEGTWLLAAWASVLFLLVIRWNIIDVSFQGRLMFPALGALNVLWAAGLLAWAGEGRRPGLALMTSGWLLGSALLVPWLVIRPAYAFPAPAPAVPASAEFGPVAFSDTDGAEIHLVGVEMPDGQSVSPADAPVEVTLYWQAARPVQRDYVSTVHLLGREYGSVGQVNRYPAWGMIPTSQWKTGQVWRDTYHVYVAKDAPAPAVLRVSVGLYDTEAQSTLPASSPDGAPMGLVLVGEARLSAGRTDPPVPSRPLEATMGDSIALDGYDLDQRALILTLYWHATGAPSDDYTVFVHLLDESGNSRGQGDGPPVGGDYPTSYWQPGEVVVDEHSIAVDGALPPGTYSVAVGLYRSADGQRLAIWDAVGMPEPENRLILPDLIEVRD